MRNNYSLSYLTASGLSPPQALTVAAQCGYTHVGLRLCASTPGGAFQDLIGDPPLMRDTLRRLRDNDVGVFDLEVIRIAAQPDWELCHRMLEAGATLGARALLVVGDDTDAGRLAQSLARLCALAQPLDLTIDLEFLPWTAVRNAGAALRVLEQAGRPSNAGVLVDALHWARSGDSLEAIAALPSGCLHYAQICDGPGHGTFTREQLIHTAVCERLLPGEGGIDLASLFRALPPQLPVSVEIPHHVRLPRLGALEWARQALAASRAVLEPSR
jgi:sugar phosphate isomerase/epimerase